MKHKPFPFSDAALARRLERAEARGNADFVNARAEIFPDFGAEWIDVAGVYAMYDGRTSPLTQTFGLGLFDEVTQSEMEAIESFFQRHDAPVFHEVSPLANPAVLPLLTERGYFPIELTNVLYRPIEAEFEENQIENTNVSVRIIEKREERQWAEIAARGWNEFSGLTGFMVEFGKISAARNYAISFFAELDGRPIATAALCIYDGIALLAGASTIPEARKRGAQLALHDARLKYAATNGCDLAMMCALPGSGSQRNAERHGFRIAYTRTKWKLRS